MEKTHAQRKKQRRLIVGIIIACGVANAALEVASHGGNSSREESDAVASLVEKRVVRADSIVVRALRTSFDLIKELQRFFNHEE
jgi:hypothetical protein